MGPRKRLLKYMESVKPKETVNTVFLVDNNGSLTLTNENNIEKFPTFVEGHPLNIASTLIDNNQSQPSTSSAHCSSAASKSPQTFSVIYLFFKNCNF